MVHHNLRMDLIDLNRNPQTWILISIYTEDSDKDKDEEEQTKGDELVEEEEKEDTQEDEEEEEEEDPTTDKNDPSQSDGLFALIMTPTRELAVQVKNHLVAIAKYTGIKVRLNLLHLLYFYLHM